MNPFGNLRLLLSYKALAFSLWILNPCTIDFDVICWCKPGIHLLSDVWVPLSIHHEDDAREFDMNSSLLMQFEHSLVRKNFPLHDNISIRADKFDLWAIKSYWFLPQGHEKGVSRVILLWTDMLSGSGWKRKRFSLVATSALKPLKCSAAERCCEVLRTWSEN